MAARTDICLFCGQMHRGACPTDKPKAPKAAPRKKAEPKAKPTTTVETPTQETIEVAPPAPMKRTAFAAMKRKAKPEPEAPDAPLDELSGDDETFARALRTLNAAGLVGPESRQEFRRYLTAPLAGDRRIEAWKGRVNATPED